MRAPEDLKGLTALRYLAAMWVVLFHYTPALQGAAVPAVIARGQLGVEWFFVLSGFILCHVYLPAYGEGRFRYGAFLWARLARIYPLHLATLAIVGVMGAAALALGGAVDPSVMSLKALPANLLLMQAWGVTDVAGWNHPSWSISAEWFAYLLFPAFAWGAWRLRARPWTAVACAGAGLAALYAVFAAVAGFPLTEATIAWGALRIVPCFALGCAAWLVWRLHEAGMAAAGGRRQAAMGALATVLLVFVGAQAGAPDALMVLLFAAAILLIGFAVRQDQDSPALRTAVYLGEVSFAVYMICIPWKLAVLKLTEKLGLSDGQQLPPLLWIILLAGVTPAAMVLHHLIENPVRGAMRGWMDQRQQRLMRRAVA